VEFKERKNDSIKIIVKGSEETYTVLKLVEFTSDRKRMSMLVRREQDGQLLSYVKGADMMMIPLLRDD
jgi:magnesium-transporting ATPase (P-type)